MSQGDENDGGGEATNHAHDDHVPRSDDQGDKDGDEAAREESPVVEGVDEDGFGWEQCQRSAKAVSVSLR